MTTGNSPGSDPVRRPAPPVAVTGLGAVSAWGWDVASFWRGLTSGRTSVRRPRRLDTRGHRTRLASEVADEAGSTAPACLSRADRFAVAAAAEAWADADLGDPGAEGTVGVFFGGSTAAMAEGEEFFAGLLGLGDARPRISLVAAHPLDGPGNAVARRLGATGPIESLSSACASGGLALGAALDALRAGTVDIAVAGGADSLCQLTYAGFNALRAVDSEPCRPFRSGRAGLNLGEGAGVLVLETLDRARRRGRRPRALLLGAGASCDAHHMTAPHPRGEGAARAIAAALADAGVSADEVGFVNAHGTGTPLNDRAEWRAIEAVFGHRAGHLPVTSTKGSIGHLLGSSGAIEAVATVLCLEHRQVHPTPGAGAVDDDLGVDLVVGGPRPLDRPLAVSTSFAFGGSNAAVVLAGGAGEPS